MAELLKGAPVVEALNDAMTKKIGEMNAKGVFPTLAIVRVGEKPDDVAYERGAMKRCEKVGVQVKNVLLPADVGQDALVEEIKKLNADAGVHGVLLFRPLPKTIDEELVRNTLAAEKDIDGITDASLAGVFTGKSTGYPPCTAQACMEILDHYGVDCTGKRAVVIGRSLVVGKPAAMMLVGKNATVTTCHTKTVDMPGVCREGEILIVSAGRPKMIGKDYFSAGQTVIDVGINVLEDGSLCGDCDFDAASELVGAITPVPGGVGTVTTSVLVKHVVEAAEKAAAK